MRGSQHVYRSRLAGPAGVYRPGGDGAWRTKVVWMVRRPRPERFHRLDGLGRSEAGQTLGPHRRVGRVRRRAAAGARAAQPAWLAGDHWGDGDGDRAGTLVEGFLGLKRRL